MPDNSYLQAFIDFNQVDKSKKLLVFFKTARQSGTPSVLLAFLSTMVILHVQTR